MPETLAPDGDALDVLVCVSEPTFPGCIVPSKVVGLFKMADEKGDDDHVLCVPCSDPGWNQLEDVDDLPSQLRREITHFFTVYKDLDADRHSEVRGWGTREEAWETIAKAREAFQARKDKAQASSRSLISSPAARSSRAISATASVDVSRRTWRSAPMAR